MRPDRFGVPQILRRSGSRSRDFAVELNAAACSALAEDALLTGRRPCEAERNPRRRPDRTQRPRHRASPTSLGVPPTPPRSAARGRSSHSRVGKDANTVALAVADEPKTVVLDLVDPLRRSRDGAAKGREAGFDEADWPASGSGGTPEHVAYITVERANAKSTITAAPPSAFRAAQTERLGCTAGTARTG